MIPYRQRRYLRQTIQFCDGRWNDEENLAKIRNVDEWKVEQLELDGNERAVLIKDIAHIQFPNMRLLSITGNCIESIEGLNWMSMPSLVCLFISQNNIRRVAVLRKAHWPSLINLKIDQNSICDHISLAEAYLPCLERFWVTWHEPPQMFFNPSFPCKLQAPSLIQLLAAADRFFMKTSTKRVFRSKWLWPK